VNGIDFEHSFYKNLNNNKKTALTVNINGMAVGTQQLLVTSHSVGT